MNKKIFICVALVFCTLALCAQPRAIGGRLGWGLEASYQHSLGSNVITVDAGFPGFTGFTAVATHDWMFSIPWSKKGSWNWFAGAGLGLGGDWLYDYFSIGIAGRFGAEYNFWFPLQISADWRPLIGPRFGNGTHFNEYGLYRGAIALSVRYLF